jgi:hypothetical protein
MNRRERVKVTFAPMKPSYSHQVEAFPVIYTAIRNGSQRGRAHTHEGTEQSSFWDANLIDNLLNEMVAHRADKLCAAHFRRMIVSINAEVTVKRQTVRRTTHYTDERKQMRGIGAGMTMDVLNPSIPSPLQQIDCGDQHPPAGETGL